MIITPNDLTPLDEFSKFRGHFCLSLDRMQKRATWEDVEGKIKPAEDETGPAFVVPGKLFGPKIPPFIVEFIFRNYYFELLFIFTVNSSR